MTDDISPPRVKPLLYVYRVLLTGIHLMQTGEVEANLVTLNEKFCLPYIAALVHLKVTGKEKATLNAVDLEFHQREFFRLREALDQAGVNTHLPDAPLPRSGLNDLLVRLRLSTSKGLR